MRKAYTVLEATSLFLQRVQLTLCGTALVLAIPACYALRFEMDAPIKGVGMMVFAAIALLLPLAAIAVAQIAMALSDRVPAPHDVIDG